MLKMKIGPEMCMKIKDRVTNGHSGKQRFERFSAHFATRIPCSPHANACGQQFAARIQYRISPGQRPTQAVAEVSFSTPAVFDGTLDQR
jgi:hypothetical protein